MISSDILRGYNDIMLLSLLLNKDSYGYELSKNIYAISQQTYQIKETTLYSAIARLERNGYIHSYEGTISNGKPRTYYTISSEGRNYLKSKIQEWKETKVLIDTFLKEDKQ